MGYLERRPVMLLILINQPAGVSFLITANRLGPLGGRADATRHKTLDAIGAKDPCISQKERPASAGLLKSDLQHQPLGVFQGFFDAHQEGDSLFAVDDAVIVGQRHIHHRADDDGVAVGDRARLDFVHP